MSTNYVVANLLEKMSSSDKDFRYMATNDLMSELKKETFRLDSATEQKMVNSVLKLLEDNNGEVQNLVVKCLPLMVNSISESQLEEVINRLCNHLSAGKEELRDVASIGLKSVVVEIPSTSSVIPTLCKRLTPKLLSTIKADGAYEVKMDSLDLLTELLSRFGALMIPFHTEVLEALLLSLAHQRPAVRKRTSGAIGHLVKNLSDKLFQTLVSHLNAKITSSSGELLRSFVSTLAIISRSAGKRLSKNLGDLTTPLLGFLRKNDDELREGTLQTLEFLILQCQAEVTALIPVVLEKSLELIKYDPNYADGDEGEDEMEDDEGEDEEQSDGEYSDDDDLSWKVRRAASKTIAAIILTRTELLPSIAKNVAPVLVSRFSEREENVRIENFSTFVVFLKRVGSVAKQTRSSDAMETSDSLTGLLKDLVPKLSKAVAKSLKGKSQKTKQIAFTVLKELVHVLNGGLESQASLFAQPIAATLGNKASSSGLKIETLTFAGALFKHHSAATFSPLLKTLVPPIVKATAEKYYKVAAEALLTLSELVQAIRPIVGQVQAIPAELVPFVQQIYTAFLAILAVQDVDQEVKEKAIYGLGYIVGQAGDALPNEIAKSLTILQEKITNEITRLVAVKTLNFVARSPLNINLSSILLNVVTELSTFLRKANRTLKLSSLICLNSLIVTRGKEVPEKQLNAIVAELKLLLNDSDLQILPLAFNLLNQILKVNKGSLATVQSDAFPAIFQIIRSPLLQGASLKSLLELWGTVVTLNAGLFDNLVKLLLEPLHSGENPLNLSSSKQPFSSISQSIATLCKHSASHTAPTIQSFITLVKKADSADSDKYLGLLSLGEIGRLNDLGANNDVYRTVLTFFSDSSEEVKSAAAFALGNIAVGNLNKYVPLILGEIKEQPKKLYLLLHSLKEIISQESQKDNAKNLIPFAEEIWAILFNNCESEEEGTRNAVAECLGKLTMIKPQSYLPALQQKLESPSAFTRATVVIAVKFTFATTSQEYNALFKSLLEKLVQLTKDGDLNVRRVSLQALNSAAHNKPGPVRDLLPVILPNLYDATVVQKELIKIVTMGPFKYEVDEGLDSRKAAFECMYTLLNTSHDIIGIFDFMERVIAGLQDKFDIKVLSHITLSQLSSLFPSAVIQKIEDFVGYLEATINTKVKDNAVKQEIEKNEELVRSALRAVVSLSRVPDSENNPRFAAFFKALKASEQAQKLEQIIAEADARDSGIDSMDTS